MNCENLKKAHGQKNMRGYSTYQNTVTIKLKGGTSQQIGENEKDDKCLPNVNVDLGTQTSIHYSPKYIYIDVTFLENKLTICFIFFKISHELCPSNSTYRNLA